MVEDQSSSRFLDEFQELVGTLNDTCKEKVAVIEAGDDCHLDEQLATSFVRKGHILLM